MRKTIHVSILSAFCVFMGLNYYSLTGYIDDSFGFFFTVAEFADIARDSKTNDSGLLKK